MAPKETPEEWAKSYIQGYIDAQPKAKRAEIEKAIKKEEKNFDKENSKSTIAIWDIIKDIPSISKTVRGESKPDFKSWQRLLSVPSHFFHEVKAMDRVFNDGLKNTDNRHMILDRITMAPDGHYYTVEIDTFAKQDKAGYKKFREYLKHRDQNQIGYSIKKNKKTKQWELFGVKNKKTSIATFSNEQQAVKAMIQAEANDYRKAGASDQAVNALIAVRRITSNGFEILFQSMRELMAHYQTTGQKLPTETVKIHGKKVTVDLKLALAKMGDMRGYYMPRIRKPGRYTVTAIKKGTHPLLKNFDSKKIAEFWASKKKQQGYKVSLDKSKRMPEDVFEMSGKVIAQEAIINEALQRIRTKKYTLEDFGLEAIDRKQGPGKRDFMVKGPTTKQLNSLFKRMGGRFFASDPGAPRVWHFENPGAYFENRLAKAIAFEKAAKYVDSSTQAVFAKALVEQVSNIIKGRGVRVHMIQRADAKGIDVWEGYEEDPRIALAKYAVGVSAGEAKKIMARDMLAHFTGTDIRWREFQKLMGGDATYENYLEFVKDRRVDPVNQPNAFKEGKSYIQNMLRNEEAVDRLVGAIKGIAVLKYLGGRVSAPLVNLTALVTSVPASMEGFGKIPIHKTFKYLAKASKFYGVYRFGDMNSLSGDIRRLFDEIHNKGWHNAQYNREALAVLRGKAGRGWDKLIDWSMIGFGVTEQLNRVTTIAGAYLGLKAQGQKDHDAMLALAKKISDRSHGTYGKANYPLIARGLHPAAQVMRAFYVFKTFSHNYMLTMKDLWGDGWKPENGKAFAYMALSPAILAGAGGIVGWDLIMKAIAMLFDLNDPEEDMYNWLEANINEYVANFARFGGFGLVGINLKGSLEIGVTDIPTTWKDVLGVPGNVISDFYEGGVNIIKGDISKGLEKISPLAIAGPIKAYREATEGLTTRTNAPIFYGRERVKADTTDAILRALSFNPARIAKIREQKWAERQQESKYTGLRTEIYSK
ncbi:MAG TPA: PLxRFG domain-containing protein, partial [Deltaproteobacteria bacterium]|nr:PLxRFG domain-containing protein [Deltaproteobacteria bacterium]